jgi:hypothetical protein
MGMDESEMMNHLEALDSDDRRCDVAHNALRLVTEQIQRTRAEFKAKSPQGAVEKSLQKEWEVRAPGLAQSYRKRSHGQNGDLVHPEAPAKRAIKGGGHRNQVQGREATDHDVGARAVPLGGYGSEDGGGRLRRHKVQRPIPDNIWEAQRALKEFDWSVDIWT